METGIPMCQPDTEVSLLLPASSPSRTMTPPLSEGTGNLFPPCGLKPLDELRLMRPFAEMLWSFPTISG